MYKSALQKRPFLVFSITFASYFLISGVSNKVYFSFDTGGFNPGWAIDAVWLFWVLYSGYHIACFLIANFR